MQRPLQLLVAHTVDDYVTYVIALLLRRDDSSDDRAAVRAVVRRLQLRTKARCTAIACLPVLALVSAAAWSPGWPAWVRTAAVPLLCAGWLASATWLTFRTKRGQLKRLTERVRARR